MEPLNDEMIVKLIKDAQRGKEAFEQLVRRYQHDVFRIIRVYTRNDSDAEDLAQETWMKVYQAIGKLKEPYHLESWLKTIAVNTTKDWLSSRARKKSQATDELQPRQLQGDAMLQYRRQQQFEQIRDAIDSLSAKNREVVYDFYICGYSATEVSQRLKIPVSTVNSRLKEARKKLREEFESMVAVSGIQKMFAPDNFVQNVMERVGRLPMSVPKGNITERIRRMLRENFIPTIGIATLIAFAMIGVIVVNLNTPVSPKQARFAGARQASNGGKIAFHSWRDGNWEIYVMDADGKNPVNLTQHGADDYNPAWSPDGKKIAFNSQRDGNGEIYVMDADGSNVKRLTNHPEEDYFAAWSPDGKKIAFPSGRDANAPREDIWVMDADGTNVQRLTFNNQVYQGLSWAPAQKIAYALALNRWDCPIFVIEPDGKNQTRLNKQQEWTEDPAWSPDGRKIAYAFNKDGNFDKEGNWEICVMDADGENVQNLTNNPAEDKWPTWSPDGEKIAFMSERDGNREIYVMNADGSNVKNLTNNPATDYWPSWSGSSYAMEPAGKLKTIWGKIKRKLFGK